MFLSNPRKSFVVSVLLIFGFSACWLWQKNDNNPVVSVTEEKGEFPFSTKEPDVFQCEIVTTADEISLTGFYARKQGKWRCDFHHGEESQISNIHAEKDYLISYQRKIYAEVPPNQPAGTQSDPLDDFTNGLLKRGEATNFEEIGRENNLIMYRGRTGDANASEVVISIDPSVGLPIKQEFYSVSSDKKTLGISVELKNLSLVVDDAMFAIPTDFAKVTVNEFRKDVKPK
jgi:hypothetical protein